MLSKVLFMTTYGPTSGDFIKRCFQCKLGYFVSWNGYECKKCTINNCEQCFYGTSSDLGTLVYKWKPKSSNS